MKRREFMIGSAAASVAIASARKAKAGAPTVLVPAAIKPLVISSANGNRFKNGGNVTCVQKAFAMITQGADVLDAVIAGVNIVELDPLDDSVGYGGLPNAEGVVQLDSSCMHGPKKQAGGVAAIEGVRTPSLVAKAVLEQTDHHLIVRAEAGRRATMEMLAEGLLRPESFYGTINCDGINSKGEICGVTTTSGLSWKIPGRVGDSPILGAGLYLDGSVGAAGSTGRGEANLYGLSSFLIIEEMRRGAHPKDAGMEALRRIKANTIEKRLLNSRGLPNFYVNFYILNAKGEYAGVTMYQGSNAQFAICDENGPQTLSCDGLLEGKPADS